MKTLERATLPWGPVSLTFFGIAFARVWLSFVFVEPGAVAGAMALPHDVFDWAFAGLSVAIVAGARHLVPLSDKRWVYGAILGAMLASSACSIAGMHRVLPVELGIAGSLVGGAAYAGYLAVNAEAFAGVSLLRIVLYLSGSRALASLMAYLLGGIDAARMTVVLLCMPCIAVALVHVAYRTLPQADRQHPHCTRFTFPWKLIVLLGVFSFAYGLRQGTLVAGAGQHSSISTGIAMGAVFVLAYFLSDRLDVAHLCRLPLPIMVLGLLLVPAEGLFGQVVSSYLISIAYTLVTFTVGILFYDMSKRTGVAIAPLIAGMNVMQIFVVLGNYTSAGLEALFPEGALAHTVTSVLVCVALVVLFVLLFSERELANRWGIRVLQESSLATETRESDHLAERCDELVRAYALTPREAEVLRELARQKENQAIARNLVIAPGTLKAHTRHIYEKMGIHTRLELNELLGIAS